MQTVSEDFLAAVRGGHTLSTRLTIIETSGTESDLTIEDGSVTLDGPSQTRASLSLDLTPDNPVPDLPGDLLAPYGNEIQVERGVRFDDGTDELVPLGRFRLDETDSNSDRGGLTIALTAFDRSVKLIEAVMENSGSIARGTNCADAILSLIDQVYLDCPYNTAEFDAITTTLPLLTYGAGDDRWDLCRGIAEAAQSSLYFDGTGTLRLLPLAIGSSLAYEIVEGDGGNLLDMGKNWGREDACTRVVVLAEGSGDEPVRGEAIDDDPNSPTWHGGPFGRKTFEWSTEYITGATTADIQAAADQVAQNILDLKRGTAQRINFSSIHNPALEPFDVVRLTRTALGVDENHVLDSLTFPLTREGTMTGETRLSRVY